MNIDSKDSELQFNFNDSLINKHFETIMDIIGNKLKNKKQIKNNREKILNLLKETFPDVTAEKLENGFSMLYTDIQENTFKTNTIKELNDSINRFSQFILSINNQFKDHGYSLLVCGYFWLTKNNIS